MRDDCDDGSRPHARAGWDNARANEQIRKMNLAKRVAVHHVAVQSQRSSGAGTPPNEQPQPEGPPRVFARYRARTTARIQL